MTDNNGSSVELAYCENARTIFPLIEAHGLVLEQYCQTLSFSFENRLVFETRLLLEPHSLTASSFNFKV